MNVRELIEQLQRQPMDQEVRIVDTDMELDEIGHPVEGVVTNDRNGNTEIVIGKSEFSE